VHNYTSVVTVPTCTEQGYTTHTCTNCGDVYVDTYVNALGHSFTKYVSNGDATCTEDGTKTAACDRCDTTDTVTDVGSKTGHSMGDWIETKAPTCTDTGTEQRDCADCDYYETREAAAKGHSYTEKVTAPSCTERGYTTHTCSVCGDSYVDTYVDATGHKMGSWQVTKAPTCTAKGSDRRDCADCDHFEIRETEAKGHSYSLKVTAPTCTERGYTTHTCACGDSFVDSYTAALGHSWNSGVVTKEPTETEPGIRTYTCTVCQAERTESIPTLDHAHIFSPVITKPTCTEGGYTTFLCSCGVSYITQKTDPLGHSWSEWTVIVEPNYLQDGIRERHCTRCEVGELKAVENNPFTDVKADRFEEPILWAYYEGITTGTGDGTTFSPEDSCTRKQIVTFLWRAAGQPEPESMENPFTDVKHDRFEKAILWAYYEGITTGTGDGTTFSPEDTCTRKQIVTFLWRAAGQPEPESMENPFTDVKHDRFEKAILWAYYEGITTGTGDGTTFSPEATCTRKQIATFLYRSAMEAQKKLERILI